jgi:hypothetical protein
MAQSPAGLDERTISLLRMSEMLVERSAALAAYSSNVSREMRRLLQRSEEVVRTSRLAHARRVDPDQD